MTVLLAMWALTVFSRTLSEMGGGGVFPTEIIWAPAEAACQALVRQVGREAAGGARVPSLLRCRGSYSN